MVAICSDIDALLQWYNGLTTHGNIHKFPEGCEHNYHYDELPVGEFAAMRFIGGKVVIINRIRTTKGGKSITAYRIASAGTGDEV